MTKHPSHQDDLQRLRKIEGQIRGVQKMIDEGRYCVDILQVLTSSRKAIEKVEENIFRRHLDGCVRAAVKSGTAKEKEEKTAEILNLISSFRK